MSYLRGNWPAVILEADETALSTESFLQQAYAWLCKNYTTSETWTRRGRQFTSKSGHTAERPKSLEWAPEVPQLTGNLDQNIRRVETVDNPAPKAAPPPMPYEQR